MDYNRLTGKHECLNRHMKVCFARYFEGFGLTAAQALCLEYIVLKNENGDVFPKDLENFLSIRGSSVASLVNYLEDAGFLSRKSASFDGRYTCLVPTQKALDIRPEITRRIDSYKEKLFAGISEEDLAVYESVIEKMTKNIK